MQIRRPTRRNGIVPSCKRALSVVRLIFSAFAASLRVRNAALEAGCACTEAGGCWCKHREITVLKSVSNWSRGTITSWVGCSGAVIVQKGQW